VTTGGKCELKGKRGKQGVKKLDECYWGGHERWGGGVFDIFWSRGGSKKPRMKPAKDEHFK